MSRTIVELMGGPFDGLLHKFLADPGLLGEPNVIGLLVRPEELGEQADDAEKYPRAWYHKCRDGIYRHTRTDAPKQRTKP
jgi:hypothetical protein